LEVEVVRGDDEDDSDAQKFYSPQGLEISFNLDIAS